MVVTLIINKIVDKEKILFIVLSRNNLTTIILGFTKIMKENAIFVFNFIHQERIRYPEHFSHPILVKYYRIVKC